MKHWTSLLIVLLSLSQPLAAVDAGFWQIGTFDEFLQGTLHDVSVSKDGDLSLAPEATALFNPDETLALSLAADRARNLYIGTGHQGKVFRVDANRKGSLFFTAREPEIFAMAAAPDGSLYVGSSPEGKIYRVTADGKSTVFAEPKTKYIWSLLFDSKGNLFAGTGDQGKILKIDTSGKIEVFLESKQTHIMCLLLDGEGNLLAGSVPNGIVYRITPQGKAFVLYQSNLAEVHDLALDAKGQIFAATLGGAGGKGTPDLFPAVVPPPGQTPAATVTVTAGTADEAGKQPKEGQAPAPGQSQNASFNRAAPQASPFPVPQLPQGRGALIQIHLDSSVETLWSSNNESVFGLAVRDGHVLFSTDSNGRIFDLIPSREGNKLTLLAQTRESLASRLLLQGGDLYVATSNIAKLFRVGATPSHEGSYESPVKDAKFISNWGVLAWRAENPASTALEFFTRSGNSEKPDTTWSDWTGPYHNAEGSPILSPPARYLQWKAVFRSTGSSSPQLHDVTAAYLNQNLPPQIRSLNVSTSGERGGSAGSSSGPASPAGTITISAGPSGGQSPAATGKVPTTFTWQAEDPNGDQLEYALYIQSADEQEWHLLKEKLRQTTYTVESNSLPDGKYVARLVASDAESNPPERARSTELRSAPFWIDNTPPRVQVLKEEGGPGGARIQFQAQDETSPLRSAEASADGGDWHDVYPDDGVADSRQETFTVRSEELKPGEHVIVLRVFDTAGNAGVGKALVRIPTGTKR